MKCSVELPIKYLKYSEYFDFDFIIASSCMEYPKYEKFYLNRKEKRFTILDNGAFETGEAVSNEEYIQLAMNLRPNVLVIPDVFNDIEETLKRYADFPTEILKKQFSTSNIEFMGVLQAQGDVSNAEMLARIYLRDGIKWIGVPYIAGLDRYQLIKKHPEWENVHILGLPHLAEIFMLRDLPNVKSIDSSLPIKITKDRELFSSGIFTSSATIQPNLTRLISNILENNLIDFTDVCHRRIFEVYNGNC